MSEAPDYVGRFAPSPTGPLHFGSLLAAVASYAAARQARGQWLLRIEDIDPPREQFGADILIIETLEAFGFEWDGDVSYQSKAVKRHEDLVAGLLADGSAYRCSCSRQDLADARRGPLGVIYPGTCRGGCSADEFAIRIRTDASRIEFEDGLQGAVSQCLEPESGDFIIKRRDGLIAYHLAVVADDADQGITEIVRGIDLLDSTPRQIHLQRLLGFNTPRYVHIPVAMNRSGQKLSKLTGADGIRTENTGALLAAALAALRQAPPEHLKHEQLAEIWRWAIENWDMTPLAGASSIEAQQFGFG